MATTCPRVLLIPAHRSAAAPRYSVSPQTATADKRAFQDDRSAIVGTPTAVFRSHPGYLTRATRWLAEAVVIGFATYGAAHMGVPLDRFQDIEPPL